MWPFHIIFYYYSCATMSTIGWIFAVVRRRPLQNIHSTNIYKHIHQKTDIERILALMRWCVPFYLFICMYMFNPNTTPSPIWDYLIMFTLAKVIYQNVTRNVTGTKTSFIPKGKQYLDLILTFYLCKYNYKMIFLQIIRRYISMKNIISIQFF